MSTIWIALVAALGFAAGPWQRARIFHHAQPAGQSWRERCSHCEHTLVSKGRRGLTAILPPTGRCPHCHNRLGPRPFTVEIITATVFGLLAWHIGQPPC
ncbi:prepilin peptidase [Allorhizocola rhizosphaerae]|uniref:prepilin peptidase n=1 Tax=Allorhizocola rhizosphaerae TaxID=1872709 RepID=UPI000E3DD9BB